MDSPGASLECTREAQAREAQAIGRGQEKEPDGRGFGAWLARQAAEPERLHDLGHSYLEGRGIQRDEVEAARQFRLAADRGHAAAQVDLGKMYLDGQGVPQSDAEALRLFAASAIQGHAPGQYALGWMYETGRGVQANRERALYWYEAAARGGVESARDALERLGAR